LLDPGKSLGAVGTDNRQIQGRDPADDESCFRRFREGDDEALGVLASRYEAQMVGLARGILGGRLDQAREIVQESWVRVIRYADSWRAECAFRTWLYRIVINCARDAAARDGRRKPAAAPAEPDVLSAASRAPASPADFESVRRAVEALPEGQSLIILLCYHRGLTHEMAAEVMDIPIGTLKSRLNAALASLRESLKERSST